MHIQKSTTFDFIPS